MENKYKSFMLFMLAVSVVFVFIVAIELNLLPNVNNLFRLAYATVTKQFISADQVGFFTLAAYPINNQITQQGFNAILNNTAPAQILSQQYYIATTGINVFPLTTPTALTDFIPDYSVLSVCSNNPANCTFYNYIPNLDTVSYANCKTCFPQQNSLTSQAILYVYPIYVAQFTANCTALANAGYAGSKLINEIEAQTASKEFVSSPVQYCGNPNNPTGNFVWQGLIGATPNYSTEIDGAFELNNPNYQVGNMTSAQIIPSVTISSGQQTENVSNSSLSTLSTTGITITPLSNSYLTEFNTTISSNVSITNATWYLNGTQIAQYAISTSKQSFTSYNASVSANITSSGAYTITLISYDSSGNVINDTLNFTALITLTKSTVIYPMAGTSLNNTINGTILGYITFPNDYYCTPGEQTACVNTGGYLENLPNQSGVFVPIPPVPNVWSGDYANNTQEIMLDSQYCWNSNYGQLTNELQTENYTQYPYLYQYQYQNATYLCLTVQATNNLLNASANIDDSNFTLNPVLPGLFQAFPDYLLVNATAVETSYEYLLSGQLTSITGPVLNQNYWFLPNETNLYIQQPAPSYEFGSLILNQYEVSQQLPIFTQQPSYVELPIVSTLNGQTITQQGVITNVSTYFYGPLLGNLTYQNQFTQPQSGTPVYCPTICQYNGSLVYSDYGWQYEYANPNYGYVFLPNMNQTLYYTPQFTVVASTPVLNDTNPNSPTYGQYCLYSGSPYTCTYGLSPQQMFANGTYEAFVIYAPNNEGTNNDTSWLVNGQELNGWQNMEGYLNSTTTFSKVVTISRLSSTGAVEWTVSGTLEHEFVPFILITPSAFTLNVNAYPPAQPLTVNYPAVVVFFIMLFGIPFYTFTLVKAKLQKSI